VEPADFFGFRPDAARARQIDRRARNELASSLDEVFAACRGHLVWDEAAGEELLSAIRRHHVTGAGADLGDHEPDVAGGCRPARADPH
jgi:hypothetical protein